MVWLNKRNAFFLDLVLLNILFFSMHYFVQGNLTLIDGYLKLWALMNAVCIFMTLVFKKYEHIYTGVFAKNVYRFSVADIYMLYITALFAMLYGITGFSSFYIVGIFVVFSLLNAGFAAVISHRFAPKTLIRNKVFRWSGRRYGILMHADIFILLFSFVCVHYAKYRHLHISSRASEVLLILTLIWFVTAGWTSKFYRSYDENSTQIYAQFVKSAFIGAALLSVFLYSFHLFEYSRGLIYGTMLTMLILEYPLVRVYAIYRQRKRTSEDIEDIKDIKEAIRREERLAEPIPVRSVNEPAFLRVQNTYLKDYPDFFHILRTKIDLNAIDVSKTLALDTQTIYNVSTIENQSLDLFINRHLANDISALNHFFLEVHHKLNLAGYFILRKERMNSHKERIYEKYPPPIAFFVFLNHFFWFRLLPKLPHINKVYNALTGGKRRVLSKTELLGRLSFCGFKILDCIRLGGYHWVIAQKLVMPAFVENPSFGPFISLKRVGYQNKIIHIKKVRTMHPYAEYVQDYIHQTNELREDGKFDRDFRLTHWGRFLRRFWLDEVPQIYNYIRGDIRIFGVRALSEHYFNLYPKDVQQLRTQVKPGLVPPYYADMPKNFDEIIESERRYLKERLNAPFKTDCRYFFKAVYNIVVKKARSG